MFLKHFLFTVPFENSKIYLFMYLFKVLGLKSLFAILFFQKQDYYSLFPYFYSGELVF